MENQDQDKPAEEERDSAPGVDCATGNIGGRARGGGFGKW